MTAIGIDTGSTSTDAVVYDLDRQEILAFSKAVTTHEKLEIGIRESLRGLPRELLDAASYISLSTTLATNACVENKGENVCLLFIGASREAVEWTLSSYGFESMDFMRFISGNPAKRLPPDWEALDAMLPDILREYGGIAVAQFGARENDGLYERQVRNRIAKVSSIPVTCSYEIFRELNVIKRGAGALLNARMAPIIGDFFDAIHHVLSEDGISLPLFIMRSDGSLVSEEYTLRYPVETLVCGPTASVKGACALFGAENAVVIDMGGTTSDLAIIKNGEPIVDNEGIRLAGWQTFVRGVSIDTLGLGGDSHVGYKHRSITLDSRRVMPVSILASRWPRVVEELEKLPNQREKGSSIAMYEHFLLLRDSNGQDRRFNATEREIIRLLRQGPMGLMELAKALNLDEYMKATERLEQLGIVLRCGFTPTDAILLKGDRRDTRWGAYGDLLSGGQAFRAAEAALRFIANSTGLEPADILDEIYRLVQEKLYCQLVRMLWSDTYAAGRQTRPPADLDYLARQAFARENRQTEGTAFFRNVFSTDAVLLGTGAPIHIFLPEVARALHTQWLVSDYSPVCNALGALLGNVCVYDTVHIKVDYLIKSFDEEGRNNVVYAGDAKEYFETMEEAIERAAEIAERRAAERAIRCGAKEMISLTHEVQIRNGTTSLGSIPLGAVVTACAKGKLL